VTFGQERIGNISQALSDLPAELHPFYRFTTFDEAQSDFLGQIWLSRSPEDTQRYMLAR